MEAKFFSVISAGQQVFINPQFISRVVQSINQAYPECSIIMADGGSLTVPGLAADVLKLAKMST